MGDDRATGLLRIMERVSGAPWGRASATSNDDDWAVLQFIETLRTSDGLPATMMILADHTGAVSRWDALTALFGAANPWQSFTEDERADAKTILESVSRVALGCMQRTQVDVVEKLSEGRRIRRRRVRKISEDYGWPDLNAMTLSIVDGMAIHELEPKSDPHLQASTRDPSSHHERPPNPFLPILDIYERGVVPNWIDWRYMNFQGEPLGPMPEPLL